MSGGLVKNNNPTKKDEMVPRVSQHKHAYGEGGPEKQSGREGPDTMPGRKGRKED